MDPDATEHRHTEARPPAGKRDAVKASVWVVLAGLAGGLLSLAAWTLTPPVEEQVGPARIAAEGVFGSGQTTLQIPPLGTVRANTHSSFLSVGLSVTELDLNALGGTFSSETRRAEAITEVESDLRSLATSLGVRVALGGLIGGAVAVALLPRRRRRYVIAGALGGLAVALVSIGLTATTFDVEAFEEPRFTGALTRAPVVIEALNEGSLAIGEVQSRYATAADRLAGLLELLAIPDLDPRTDTTALLHISDVHSNPVGLEIARQLAKQFAVDAILDTGDLTNFGLSVESNIARLIQRFNVPYYFVPGNHDSIGVRRALAATPGVTVLDGVSVEVAGATVFGWPDPTYTNWNRLPPDEAALIRESESAEVAAAIREDPPDILAVHDHRLATGSFGLVPLVLSGHYHRQIIEEHEGTRLLAVGSTGAAGLQSFTVDATQNYEAQIVYLRAGTAIAIDYVRFTGLGSDFVIERKTLAPLEPTPTSDETPAEEEAEG